MHALPLLLSSLAALALAPALLRGLAVTGNTAQNFRGRRLPRPFGLLVPAAALIALVPLLAVGVTLLPGTLALYVIGVSALGLVDDLFGSGAGAPRGLRGHAAALLRGHPTTGALKAAGSFALALPVAATLGGPVAQRAVTVAVLVLSTNLFNLLDLRPGRALKAFVLLATGLLAGSGDARPLWSLGLLAGPAVVAGAFDLRERAMLGDTGANLLGAIAGLWLVLALSPAGRLAVLAALLAATAYGELRSISALVDRKPWLRRLDCWGRPA